MKEDEFVEPPWVYGPTEVNRWIDAVYPSKNAKRVKDLDKPDYVEDLHIFIDLKDEKEDIGSLLPRIILKPLGLDKVKEKLDSIEITEKLLRGFAKAGFRNTADIELDGELIYKHPEKNYDLRETIEFIGKYKKTIHHKIKFKVLSREKQMVYVTINTIHMRREHPIEIRFKGKIKVEVLHSFLNYITEHMNINILPKS